LSELFRITEKLLTKFYEHALPPYLGLSVIVGFICMVGLWKMKKWAAYAYTAFVITNQIVFVAMGVWTIMALVIPAIVVGIALYHIGKMD
jgi:hypothetical protein